MWGDTSYPILSNLKSVKIENTSLHEHYLHHIQRVLKVTACFHTYTFISKDQETFDFSYHRPFNTPNLRKITIISQGSDTSIYRL